MQPALVGTRGGDRAAVAQLADAMQRVAELRLDDGTQILACVPGERLVSELGPRHAVAQLAVIDTQHVFAPRSEEHTFELQSLMRISYAVFCLKKKITSL